MTSYMELTKNYMMPTGGTVGPGEIVGADPVAIASGAGVPSGPPAAYVPPAVQRVKLTETQIVNNSPPLYDAGEIATFPAAVSAALIAAGLAIAN
jgi:hypothetical protein